MAYQPYEFDTECSGDMRARVIWRNHVIRNATPSAKATQNDPQNKFTQDEWHIDAPLLAKEQDADQSDLDKTLNVAPGPRCGPWPVTFAEQRNGAGPKPMHVVKTKAMLPGEYKLSH